MVGKGHAYVCVCRNLNTFERLYHNSRSAEDFCWTSQGSEDLFLQSVSAGRVSALSFLWVGQSYGKLAAVIGDILGTLQCRTW